MGAGLSTGAALAITFNCVAALLLLLLLLIVCRACRTPSCPEKRPPAEAEGSRNEGSYLLQP